MYMKKRERKNKDTHINLRVREYDDNPGGLATEDTRILDRSIEKQPAFDRWLWQYVALNPNSCLEVDKVVYASARELKISSVTTRRYLLERIYDMTPSYAIHNHMVYWLGKDFKKSTE
jgi:hypothetical protein